MLTIGSICNHKPVCCAKEASVAELSQLMRTNHVGSVMVVQNIGDGPRLLGVVTDRDLVVEVLAQDIPPESVQASDLIARKTILIHDTASVPAALEKMRVAGIRRLPVVDSLGVLVGVVSMDDLLVFVADLLAQVSGLVHKEQSNEHRQRASVI